MSKLRTKLKKCVLVSTLVGSVLQPAFMSNTNLNAETNVGSGINWTNKKHIFAPFIDMTNWVSQNKYSLHGAPNMGAISKDTGTKYFNVGFIQSSGLHKSTNKMDWGFGGYASLSKDANSTQYQGIRDSIAKLRENNGDVIMSFGGQSGTPIWMAQGASVEKLVNTYKEIIKSFNLTAIDFDIEVATSGSPKNEMNAKAIKQVQHDTGVKVNLTLPVMPDGLTWNGVHDLESYIKSGVDLNFVNIMTMCYGSSVKDYTKGSMEAIDSLKNQIKAAYKKYNVNLTDEQSYVKVGATPSIGFESSSHPLWKVADSKKLYDYEVSKNIGMSSFWVMDRDAKLGSTYGKNKGIYSKYEHTNVFKNFGKQKHAPVQPAPSNALTAQTSNHLDPIAQDSKQKPNTQIHEHSSTTIKDPSAAQTSTLMSANDNTALPHTSSSSISVKPNTEIKVPVSESKSPLENDLGLSSSVAKESNIKEWSSKSNYPKKGTKVLYKGNIFESKWWINRNVKPLVENKSGSKTGWKLIQGPDLNKVRSWNKDNTYLFGSEVTYKSKHYLAKWWCGANDVPGSSEAWNIKSTK